SPAAGLSPSTPTEPLAGRISPSISFISVVLPAPLWPIRATSSPAISSNEAPQTALTRPYSLVTSVTRTVLVIAHPRPSGASAATSEDGCRPRRPAAALETAPGPSESLGPRDC